MSDLNKLALSGEVVNIELAHEHSSEKFYRYTLEVPRMSGNIDSIPVIVSDKLLYNNEILKGDFVTLEGQVRTKNKKTQHKKGRVIVFSHAVDIKKITEEEFSAIEDKNQLKMHGHVVKNPVYRETKTGRKITELILASNRPNGKSNYIPSIAWGVDATFAKKFKVGDKISLEGRFQSRDYLARGKDDEPVTKTAYEVSISNLWILEQ